MAKVLLVEDDNNLREIYQARLMAEGYDIVAAQNGEEALVVAKQNKPDLIISDVMMPRISGFEMLDILRNTEGMKHTKVIMLTALGQAEDQQRANNLGADKYLVKSQVTLEDIVNAAKELLGESEEDAGDTTIAEQPAIPAVAPIEQAIAPVPEPINTSVPQPVAPQPVEPVVIPQPEPVVPASVVPQVETTVVVPPTPANPAPPTVTTVPIPPVTAEVVPVAPVPSPQPAPAVVIAAPEPELVTLPPTGDTAPLPAPADTSQPAPVLPPVAPPNAVDVPVEPAVTTAAATANAASQTIEDEEAALQAQIESYAHTPAAPTQEIDPTTAANNDAAIAEAVEALNTPTVEAPIEPPSVANAPAAVPTTEQVTTIIAPVQPEPTTPPVAPQPSQPTPNLTEQVNVAGKKVIQPLNDLTMKPNLDELLAKEEAKAEPAPAAPIVNGSAVAPPATPPPIATPGSNTVPTMPTNELGNVTL